MELYSGGRLLLEYYGTKKSASDRMKCNKSRHLVYRGMVTVMLMSFSNEKRNLALPSAPPPTHQA